MLAGAYALDEVTVLHIDRAHMEELVLRKPLLLQEIGRAIEDRRANVPAGIGYGPRLGGGRQLVVDPAPAPFHLRRRMGGSDDTVDHVGEAVAPLIAAGLSVRRPDPDGRADAKALQTGWYVNRW